jgi:hypothetical protein
MAVAANPVSAANTFGSCDDLHSKYPSGVAKNKKAARAIVASGFEAPKVNAALYRTHYRDLDRDRDGVMCEVPL